MKTVLRRPELNPAFKRFQNLPSPPAGAANNRASAAPRFNLEADLNHQDMARHVILAESREQRSISVAV
jgi:hypothetical protein